jgi:hypothetical protein
MRTINHVSGQNNAFRTLLSSLVSVCETWLQVSSVEAPHLLPYAFCNSGNANEMFIVHFNAFYIMHVGVTYFVLKGILCVLHVRRF